MLFKREKSFDENNTQSIIEACLSGNRKAEDALYKRFTAFAKLVVFRNVTNTQDADEIINDCFLKAIFNLKTYNKEKPFEPWFRAIIERTAINFYKKNLQTEPLLSLDDIDVSDEEVDIMSKMASDEILNLVQELTPAYRSTFNMFVGEGYSHREIAEKMKINEVSSRTNLKAARLKLQLMIQNKYPDLYLSQTFNDNLSDDE